MHGNSACAQQFERTKQAAAELIAGLDASQFNWHPASPPGQWSVAECLEHLATGSDAVLPAIDRAIGEASAKGWRGDGPFRYGWFARLSIRSMEPPVRWRLKTAAMLEPRVGLHQAAEVLSRLSDSRDRLLERVRRSEGLDLKRAVVTSPVSRWVRMPLGGYLDFLAAHDRRHLWQAEQVRKRLPRS